MSNNEIVESSKRFKIHGNDTNVVIPDLKNLKASDIYNSPNNALKEVSEAVSEFLESGGPLDGLSDGIKSITETVGGVTDQVNSVVNEVKGVVQGVTSQVNSVVGQVQAKVAAVQSTVENTVRGVQSQIKGVVDQVQGTINAVVAPVDVVIRQAKGYAEQLQDLAGVPAKILSDIGGSALGDLPGVKGALNKLSDNKVMDMLSRVQGFDFGEFSLPTDKLDVAKLVDKATGGLYSKDNPLEFLDLNAQFDKITAITSISFDVGLSGSFEAISVGADERVKTHAGTQLLSQASKAGNLDGMMEMVSNLVDKGATLINPNAIKEIYEAPLETKYDGADERLLKDQFLWEGPYDLDKRVESYRAMNMMGGKDVVVEVFRASNTDRSLDLNELDVVYSNEKSNVTAVVKAGLVN